MPEGRVEKKVDKVVDGTASVPAGTLVQSRDHRRRQGNRAVADRGAAGHSERYGHSEIVLTETV